MKEKPYPFATGNRNLSYDFVSVSSKKKVRKKVIMIETEDEKVFNLALVDVLDDGSLCDIAETNNNDLRTVLATVIRIIHDFLSKNLSFYVIFRGSDARRHRLYGIVIAREFEEISKQFEVWGITDSIRYPFALNTLYEFYMVKKKI